MSEIQRQCLNLTRPKYYSAILVFLAVYAVLYFMTSVDIFDNSPDGTSIDFSDVHKRELIEAYRREKEEEKRLESSKDRKTASGVKFDGNGGQENILDNNNEEKGEDENVLKNTPGGREHRLNPIEGNTSTNDLDPDLADIFYDAKVKSDIQPDKVDRSQKSRRRQEANEKLQNDLKVLNYKYDSGDVVINAADLLEYEEELSNKTKILPKQTFAYKCWEGAFFTEPYLLRTPVGEIDFECMDLRVTPSTPICLYQSEEDVFISAYLRYNGVWEGHIVDQLQRALSQDEELGLIDLGANLGQYSLIAAKMGRKVLAVEPYSQTLRRFKKAAQMGKLIPNIRVLKNAIADVRTDMYIHLNLDNMGDARVDTTNSTCKKNCELVKSVLLSDIVPYLTFNKAVLKIDIQGFENVIFYYADHLFNNVYIPYIFVEWVLLRDFYVHMDHKSAEKRDVEFTIMYLTARGYVAYSSINGKKLNLEFWGGWPEDVYWVLQSIGDHNIFDKDAVKPKFMLVN